MWLNRIKMEWYIKTNKKHWKRLNFNIKKLILLNLIKHD